MSLKSAIKPYLGPHVWRFLQLSNRSVHQARAARRRAQEAALNYFLHARNKTHVCDVRGKKARIHVSNRLELYRARTYSTKEPEFLDWIDTNLRESDVFFDIGANIGLYSIYAALSKPTARVFAFEPEGQNFSRLCRNAYASGCPNLVPCGFPLTSGSQFDYFYLSEFVTGSSLHNFGGSNEFTDAFSKATQFRQGAFGTSVDDLVEKHGAPVPNLIKIDVDGIEEKIVEGMLRTLRNPAVRSVFIEIQKDTESTVSPIERTLAAEGFRLAGKGRAAKLGHQICQNHIFLRNS